MFEFLKIPDTPNRYWQIGTFFGLLLLAIIYFSTAAWYKQTYGQFTSNPESIKALLTIRNHDLSTSAVGTPNQNIQSACTMITNKSVPYKLLSTDKTSLVNWRPLTVRLAGYLGGIYTARNGVFDMQSGIQYALDQGARAFVFDIDYLEESPCNAVLMHRDSKGYMRSLHTGSIKEGCNRLSSTAFKTNTDPVLIILYFRRIPAEPRQKETFFRSVSRSLEPLSIYHLGSNSYGDFHNCKKESELFKSPITNFQNNFIVLTNYNTSLIDTINPKDNLHYWTNARIYQDPSGSTAAINSVTPPAPTSGTPSVMIGSTTQLLNIGISAQSEYNTKARGVFIIALSDIEYSFSVREVNLLLNVLGIQCVPLDVVRLASVKDHEESIQIPKKSPAATLDDLANAKNPNDVLSFWCYAGWSTKLMIQGFENPLPVATPIPGFIIPTPIVPKKPPPSTNSNGGLVTIGQ